MSDDGHNTLWIGIILVGIHANLGFTFMDGLLTTEQFGALGYLLLSGIVLGQRLTAHRRRQYTLADYYLADSLNSIRDLLAITFIALVLLTTAQRFNLVTTPTLWVYMLGGVGVGLGLLTLIQLFAQLLHRRRQLRGADTT